MRQLSSPKLRLRPLVWRGVAALTLAAYSLLTLACAVSIVFGIWYGLVTVSLIGSALRPGRLLRQRATSARDLGPIAGTDDTTR